jgi:hypothetical protein
MYSIDQTSGNQYIKKFSITLLTNILITVINFNMISEQEPVKTLYHHTLISLINTTLTVRSLIRVDIELQLTARRSVSEKPISQHTSSTPYQ